MYINPPLIFGGRIRSVKCALKGLSVMLSTQPNARLHSITTLLVIVAGTCLELTRYEWCWVVAAIAIVWIAEAFNTALEFLTDIARRNFIR